MTKNNTIKILLPVVAVLIAVVAVVSFKKEQGTDSYQKDSGFVFGTSYNITYNYGENLKDEIEKVLKDVDNSLSPFNEKSTITAINNNECPEIDDMFYEVFNISKDVNKETDGAFDITVAPLVNAWGFGFKSGNMPAEDSIKQILQYVGFEKLDLIGRIVKKKDPRMMLDCSAVAKGYGVDQVALMLDEKGIKNYMVEIGGEIVAKGVSQKKQPWRIGVTKPTDDSLSVNNELETVLQLTDIAMATSGNYRNFYYKDGKKYAHTIDPKTGKPVQHNVLSATVLAPSCARADAYATSFMVLGLEKAQEILSRHKELKAYLIYTNDKGEYSVWHSPGIGE